MEHPARYMLESYLITGQDYADFQVALRRMKTGRRKIVLFRLFGMALILLSLLGRVYFAYRNSYNSTVWFLLTCLGVGICLYYDYCMPYIVRRNASRYFDLKFKKMVANSTEIDDSGIRFISEIGDVRIPYEQLCRAYEDERVILLEKSGEIRFLPKRVLTLDEYKGVREFLKRALREKYLQEGVC